MLGEGLVEVKAKTYTLLLERDARGWWVASVREVPGCHTQGRTLRQARARAREALGLYVADAQKASLSLEIRLPARASRVLAQHRNARVRAEKEIDRAQRATREAVQALTKGLHLGVRDAGELLGLSHQRVQQLQA